MGLKQTSRLKATTTLRARKPLKATKPIKSRVKAKKPVRKPPVRLEKKSAKQLIKPTDAIFSRYIRLRDSYYKDGQWVGVCITCPRQLIVINDEGKWIASSQNGHLISRGVLSLRFDELNCNLQCAHCNAWLDKDEMIGRYRKAVDDKYGNGTYKQLKALSKAEGAYKCPPKIDLLQTIDDSKEYIAHALAHPDNYSK